MKLTPHKESKVKVAPAIENEGHTGHLNFLPCPLNGSVPIWVNHFICSIHTTHEGTWCARSKFKVIRVVWSFHCVRSIAPYLFHWFTSYQTHTQPMRSQCLRTTFKSRGQKSRSHGSFEVLVMSALRLPAYLTTSYVAYIQHVRGGVSSSIFRMKGQRSRLHGSFQVLVLSALWPRPYLTESLHM